MVEHLLTIVIALASSQLDVLYVALAFLICLCVILEHHHHRLVFFVEFMINTTLVRLYLKANKSSLGGANGVIPKMAKIRYTANL